MGSSSRSPRTPARAAGARLRQADAAACPRRRRRAAASSCHTCCKRGCSAASEVGARLFQPRFRSYRLKHIGPRSPGARSTQVLRQRVNTLPTDRTVPCCRVRPFPTLFSGWDCRPRKSLSASGCAIGPEAARRLQTHWRARLGAERTLNGAEQCATGRHQCAAPMLCHIRRPHSRERLN